MYLGNLQRLLKIATRYGLLGAHMLRKFSAVFKNSALLSGCVMSCFRGKTGGEIGVLTQGKPQRL